MKRLLLLALCICSLSLLLSGCGGGGGNSASPDSSPQPTSVVLKLSTQGTLPPGISIAGIGITVNLPAGVTVTGDAAGNLFTPSGVAAGATFLPPDYTAPTATTGGKIGFILAGATANGFGIGEFVTITCSAAPGVHLSAADFSLTGFSPIDLSGRGISDLSVAADVK